MSRPSWGVVVACAAVALSLHLPWPTAPSTAQAITNCSTNTAALDAAEQEMLRLHNETRAAHDLGSLTPSASLNRAAAWKSEDSSASGGSFSHTDSLGRNPVVRAMDCGYPSSASENIAYGYPSASATFDAWMNSPGHRANILAPDARAIGIGASGNSWTVKFGTVVDSGATPPPPTATSAPAISTPVPPTATPWAPTATPVIPTSTPVQAPATATATPTRRPPTQDTSPGTSSATLLIPSLARMAAHGGTTASQFALAAATPHGFAERLWAAAAAWHTPLPDDVLPAMTRQEP